MAVVLVAAALAASAAGCSGDPDPIVTETPTPTAVPITTPSPTPTPSPSATELTDEEVAALLPSGAMTADLWGAFAFASTLITESRSMVVDGDTRLFEALSTETCTFCANALSYARSLNAANESLSGGQISIESQTPQGGLQPDGLWQLEFDIAVEEAAILDQSGAPTVEVLFSEHRVAVLMEHDGNAWLVRDVGSEEG
ncbi:DUF6318 family protein [Demequina sp. SO4-13]|uniref:DUF6318 family protein n=1 Tax=Demequina sp. SO4-13 TaxID=3401027 RepID=UPI003AF53795